MNSEQPSRPTKKIKRKIAAAVVIAAATAYGTLAYLHNDPDPTSWQGERSGYESTK